MQIPDFSSRVHASAGNEVATRVELDIPDGVLMVDERVRLALLLQIPEPYGRVATSRHDHVARRVEVARANPITVPSAAHEQLGRRVKSVRDSRVSVSPRTLEIKMAKNV